MYTNQPPVGVAPVVVVKPPKSVGLAVVLAFFFGPFGMFYATTTGALVILAIDLIVLGPITVLTLGIGGVLYFAPWIAGMIWAGMAVNSSNRLLVAPLAPVMPVISVSGPAVGPYQGQSGPYQQPGSMPNPYQQAPGPYEQPSGQYQQPGSMPNPYQGQSGPYQQPGQMPPQ